MDKGIIGIGYAWMIGNAVVSLIYSFIGFES